MRIPLLLLATLIAASGRLAAAQSTVAETAPMGSAASEFFRNLQALCGRRFKGRIIEDRPPPAADDPFSGRALEMHVQDCSPNVIRIPFAVGDDRSRTWIVTREPAGLRLKHDHRHTDGTPDTITMYGGDSVDAGTSERQRFPADAETIELFRANDMPASLPNVWALELVPGQYFVYELARPTGRLFRVRFDIDR